MIFTVNLSVDINAIPINPGDIVHFEKDRGNKVDSKAIKAIFKMNSIGYVSKSSAKTIANAALNSKIYDLVEDKFDMPIQDIKTINIGATTDYVLVFELGQVPNTSNIPVQKVDDNKKYQLKFKGSTTNNPAKTTVISDFNSGKTVSIDIKVGDGSLCAYYNNKKAGNLDKINNSGLSSIDDIDELISFADKIEITGTVISSKVTTSYIVEVTIDNKSTKKIVEENIKKGCEKSKQRAIKIVEPAKLDKIEKYLTANNITPETIQMVFNSYKEYPDEVKGRIIADDSEDITLFMNEGILLQAALNCVLNKIHPVFKGDKGCGKNTLLNTLSWILQRPLYTISISKETGKEDLYGGKTIDTQMIDGKAIDKMGFDAEVLIQAMEIGGIVCIDEINFADAGITSLLHSIGDMRCSVEVPGYKYVKGADNFCMIGTMNPDYLGTQELNKALGDRFVPITFPSPKSIVNILKDRCPKASAGDINLCNKVYVSIANLVEKEELESSDNTVRGFEQALKIKEGIGLKQAVLLAVANKITYKEDRNSVETIINAILQ